MKLDNWTKTVLENFSLYNEGMVFVPGSVQTTKSPRAVAFSYLQQEFPQEFAIADLSTLKSALGLFADPDIEFGDKSLIVKGDSESLEYGYAAKDTIKHFDTSKTIPVKDDVQFGLKWEQASRVLKAASILGFPEIAFQSKGGKLVLRTWNAKKPTASGFSIELGETTQEFAFVFRLEDMKFIPKDYAVTLSFKKIAKFQATDGKGDPEVIYYVGAEESSAVPK